MNPQDIFLNSRPAAVPPPPPLDDNPLTGLDNHQPRENFNAGQIANGALPVNPHKPSAPAMINNTVGANPTLLTTSEPAMPTVANDFPSLAVPAPTSDNQESAPAINNPAPLTSSSNETVSADANIAPVSESSLDKTQPLSSNSKKNPVSSPMPLSIITILFLAVFVLIGLGVFTLWYHQYRQINGLNAHLKTVIEDRNQLNEQLEQARQNLVLNEKKPIFLEESGAFSFYQDMPNLVVQKTDKGALLHFGEVVGDKATNGFVMKIEGQQTNGKSLDEIVSSEMAQKVVGATRTDKQDEGTKCYNTDNKEQCYISDKIGFSYVERGNDYWKVIYFLRNDPHATYYLRIEFAPAGNTPASQDEYGRIGGQILSSIKIYRGN